MMILAIDPAPTESGYCIMDEFTYKAFEKGKVSNEELSLIVKKGEYGVLVIEMIKNMGMSALGQDIFHTCVWIGRFIEMSPRPYEYVYRHEEKMNICGSMKAKDSNIRQALIDRFGEVGTKNNPGWFYGFKADLWSAYAVGCTYLDKHQGE